MQTCVGFFLQFYLNFKNGNCNNKNDDRGACAYQLRRHEDNVLAGPLGFKVSKDMFAAAVTDSDNDTDTDDPASCD